MADGSATPARVTRRGGWTRESEGMWRREVGALRLVVYPVYGRTRRWHWLVRQHATTRDSGETRFVVDAKVAAVEAARRLGGGAT